jgi:C-terminal processing protease CtpA/Prc
MFNLPGGGSARVCTKKDTYPDGREFVGYGVKPDIEVHGTVRDLLQKSDPVLDTALKYLRSKIQK